MSDKILNTAWRSYAERVIPADASDYQRRECRLAFYAGARSLFTGIIDMLDPGDEATDADCAKMGMVEAELEQFYNDVKNGEA